MRYLFILTKCTLRILITSAKVLHCICISNINYHCKGASLGKQQFDPSWTCCHQTAHEEVFLFPYNKSYFFHHMQWLFPSPKNYLCHLVQWVFLSPNQNYLSYQYAIGISWLRKQKMQAELGFLWVLWAVSSALRCWRSSERWHFLFDLQFHFHFRFLLLHSLLLSF